MPMGLDQYEGIDLVWRRVLAAAFGGTLTILMSYPFEVIQTRQ